MNVLITHFKKKDDGNTFYYNGKAVHQVTTVKLPIKFGFGSYNEPMKVMNYDINVEDIVSIVAEGELTMSDDSVGMLTIEDIKNDHDLNVLESQSLE